MLRQKAWKCTTLDSMQVVIWSFKKFFCLRNWNSIVCEMDLMNPLTTDVFLTQQTELYNHTNYYNYDLPTLT